MLQQDASPRNSWVYFIIVQYPLMRVKAPDGGADPQPDDVTRPEMVRMKPIFFIVGQCNSSRERAVNP